MRLMDESTIVNLSKRIAGSIQAGGPGSGRRKSAFGQVLQQHGWTKNTKALSVR